MLLPLRCERAVVASFCIRRAGCLCAILIAHLQAHTHYVLYLPSDSRITSLCCLSFNISMKSFIILIILNGFETLFRSCFWNLCSCDVMSHVGLTIFFSAELIELCSID